jgi:hypothetical protein
MSMIRRVTAAVGAGILGVACACISPTTLAVTPSSVGLAGASPWIAQSGGARVTAKRHVAARPSPVFASGIDEDALACAQWKAGNEPVEGSAIGVGCATEHLNALCAADSARVVPQLSAYLKAPSFNVMRALARYNMISDERNGSLCDVGARGQPLLIAIAVRTKQSPPKKQTEQNPDRLLSAITGRDGAIDAGAYSRAVDERRAIVAATGNDAAMMAGLPVGTGADGIATDLKTAGLPADASGWTNLTGYVHPVGRINDVLVDTTGTKDTRTLWAGTDGGGIWKSTNNGSSWTPVNDKLGSLVIGKILRSAVDPQVMYASTNPLGSHSLGPYGIIKSSDGGVTWNQLAQTNPATNADFLFVSHLAIHPAGVGGHDVLLAATDKLGVNGGQGGIYQSNDSGATWTKISADVAGSFVMFHPSNGDRRAYALMNGSVFVTTTGTFGATPASSVVTGTNAAYIKLAWAPSDPNIMYAMARFDFSLSSNITRLYRSSTAGTAWTQVPMRTDMYNGSRSLLNFTGAVWVDPTNPNRIAAAEVWAGSTADATTANATTGWKRSNTGWADFHGIVHDPGYDGTTNRIVYMVDDGGLYRYNDIDTIDSQMTTAILTTGMTITQAYSVAGRGGNVILGAQDVAPRVYRTGAPVDPADKWRLIGAGGGAWIGDGAYTAASRTNPGVLYGSKQYLELFRSDDGGVTGTSICGAGATRITEGRCGLNFEAPFIAPFVLDPGNNNTLWAAGTSLWRTQNATASPPAWLKAHAPHPLIAVTAIAVAPGDSNTVWAGYSGFGYDLYKSVNATANPPTFTLVPAVGLPADTREISRIMIDRTNSLNVWVALTRDNAGPRLFFTNNGGATFTPVNGLPQAAVFALAQHPSNPAWIYAGTLVGLFASHNSGQTWGASNEGPANVMVRDLNWYSESGQSAELLVATFGRGIWRTTVVSSTPTLTVTRSGSGAGDVLDVLNGINCGGDCNEAYGAPTPVNLIAVASPGNVFTGWLGACTGASLTCSFTVSSASTVSATFAPGATTPKLDPDANNPTMYDALTDGLMIVRYLFNLNVVTTNALGPNATRTTDAAIVQHLTNLRPMLDVDGNGQADALTDGLMILRYLFQIRGASLIANAIGAGATRTTAPEIEAYLASVLQ